MSIKDSYRDNPLLKKSGVELSYTQEQIEEYVKCAQDPVYFVENYVQIVNVDRGLIPFDMWDFQKDMIRLFKDNRFVITKCPRQVGKTTTAIGYVLWLSIFNDSQNIAILANKGSLARDILSKYQLAYENLPKWLQQGVVTWNKGDIELENGSKILAASTSSSAIRGGAFNLVFLDEFAFVPPNIASEFFTSVYPVISSGKMTQIIIVSTPNGMNLFYKMWMDAVEKRSLYIPYEIHWSMVPGRDEKWKEETIKNTSEQQFRQEFETEFLGSSNTLINGSKLRALHFAEPIETKDHLQIYNRPVKETYDDDTGKLISGDHLYAITVDISEGKNMDYSAFSIFDISQIPYVQVAKYRNNNISPILFPNVILSAAKYYNDAYILVEINNNPQVADIIHSDLEYENILKVATGNKKAQQISAGFTKNAQLGIKMSPLVKRIGCSNLKTLIENDKLIIKDFDTISELTTFIADNTSFSADGDANDDLVMTLVLFGWLASQKYFKEISNNDIRKQLQMEHFDMYEEEMLPVGEIDDGQRPHLSFMMDGDDVWVETNSADPYGDYFRYIKN